jgi:hypothetical protein
MDCFYTVSACEFRVAQDIFAKLLLRAKSVAVLDLYKYLTEHPISVNVLIYVPFNC